MSNFRALGQRSGEEGNSTGDAPEMWDGSGFVRGEERGRREKSLFPRPGLR
ncbi:MAG: hypothetical protein HZC44_02500 [Geobacter sp.]|nr:hypothetical protein [Geobacter sp.]